jgi:glycosyltransferase involved in cell wall biosynthesis
MVKSRKKILFVIGQLDVGGAERQMLYLATNLNPERYLVKVCSFSADIPLLSMFEGHSIETIVLPKTGNPDLTRPFKLFQLVKEFQPDLIHSYLFVANTWSRIVGTLLRIPVILSERSSELRKPKWQKLIERLLFPFGSLLIANSQSGAKRVIENKEFKAGKVKVVYNGVPLEKYKREISEETRLKLRSELQIPESSKVIGIIGRLHYCKNHELLFESFEIINNQIPDLFLLCIGDGPRKDELEKLADLLGIQDKVIFAGIREDIPECLSIMDVLVLPSRWEGFPNVLLEAMAAKCPVIATKVGGVEELINDGQTGLLVNSENKFELSDKIKLILEDIELTNIIKENAFNSIVNNFSLIRMVENTEKYYGKLLD